MEPSGGSSSTSKKSAKNKSNSLPLAASAPPQSKDDLSTLSTLDQDIRKLEIEEYPYSISRSATNLLTEQHNTQCEGPGNQEAGFSILETIACLETEDEDEKWADARSEFSPAHTPLAPALSLSKLNTTTNDASPNYAVTGGDEPLLPDNNILEDAIAAESRKETEAPTRDNSESNSASDNFPSSSRIAGKGKLKQSDSASLDELYPQLRRKLGLHLMMVNLGRSVSFRTLSDGESVTDRSEDEIEVDVYRMEKRPERIAVNQEELWFHRPDWLEYPNILPEPRNHDKVPEEHLLLIVDATNQAEDTNDAELFMMHHRVLRSNQAALNTIIAAEEMQEVCLTPHGFEYSDIVLERKFFISWKVAQLYQKSKKDYVRTTIPLTGTKYFKRSLPLRIRIWRRMMCFFRFRWLSRRNYVQDEGIIRQDSIEAFHNEIFAIEVRGMFPARGGKNRLIYRRENIFAHPISTDNLLPKDHNKIRRRK